MSDVPRTMAEYQPATRFWIAPWEFVVHTLVGTFIFSIIAAAAVGLDVAVGKLNALGISEPILVGIRIGEGALFLTDLILFAVFLWRTGKRAIEKL
jgi:hypothetical protein